MPFRSGFEPEKSNPGPWLLCRALLVLALSVGAGFSLERTAQARETHRMEDRERMVRNQIQARGLRDANVLRAMLKIERHLFVPESEAANAYQDFPLPIGYGQTISQPYIVAFMTEILALGPKDRVLEIGTGSGYQTAVLAEISERIFTVEILPELARSAEERLRLLGYRNIEFKIGDGYEGWPDHAPYDAILVTAAPEEIPSALLDQLKDSGGRLIVPVGPLHHQELIYLRQEGPNQVRKTTFPVRFVPMTHSRNPESS